MTWRACPSARNNKLTIRKDLFLKKGRGLHHEFGLCGSCEEKAGAVGAQGATPGPADGEGTWHERHFRVPSSEASGVSPSLHHLEGVQSKLLGRAWPGLRNKYRGPQSRGRAEGKSSTSPGPHTLPSSVLHGRMYHGRRGSSGSSTQPPGVLRCLDLTEVPGRGLAALCSTPWLSSCVSLFRTCPASAGQCGRRA